MSLEAFCNIYRAAGFTVELENNQITLEIENNKFKVTVEDDWEKSIKSYFKAKQFEFDFERRILKAYKSIEIQLLKIDPLSPARPDYEFKDEKGNTVQISAASHEYCLAYLENTSKNNAMLNIIKRFKRKAEIRKPNRSGYITIFKFDELFVIPTTAKYKSFKKVKPDILFDRAEKSIKASLFSLSYSLGECWEIRERVLSLGASAHMHYEEPDFKIPKVSYKDDLVTFYKVARSSIFPNQEFLSYYHVIEYYFLRVSDEILHTGIKSLVNSPSFNASYENVNKLIAAIKKNDNSTDETEMLRAVLKKYVDEDDLIDHIKELERLDAGNTYSDTKKKVFGEQASIKLEKGHALTSTGRVIKHIRNALVHSSDKYNREDCFMPFSDSESVVISYIPIVKFIAEKIIFSTAE